MYTPQAIKERMNQQPFIPVRLVTSSGNAYEVYHPDMVWVGAREVHVGFSTQDDPSLYDGTARLAIMHITALEDLPAKVSKSKKNGKA